jgi:hypothetical protein
MKNHPHNTTNGNKEKRIEFFFAFFPTDIPEGKEHGTSSQYQHNSTDQETDPIKSKVDRSDSDINTANCEDSFQTKSNQYHFSQRHN